MNLSEYLQEYIDRTRDFNAGTHNGRRLGQEDVNKLLSAISEGNLDGVHKSLLDNLSSNRTIDQLLLRMQRIARYPVAMSPLSLALNVARRDIHNPIVRYLLLILIYWKIVKKNGKYYEWVKYKDECPIMGDFLNYDLFQSPDFNDLYNESIQMIRKF
jgi:hypothetical protein